MLKLVNNACLWWKKTEFPFFVSPIFGYCHESQTSQPQATPPSLLSLRPQLIPSFCALLNWKQPNSKPLQQQPHCRMLHSKPWALQPKVRKAHLTSFHPKALWGAWDFYGIREWGLFIIEAQNKTAFVWKLPSSIQAEKVPDRNGLHSRCENYSPLRKKKQQVRNWLKECIILWITSQQM